MTVEVVLVTIIAALALVTVAVFAVRLWLTLRRDRAEDEMQWRSAGPGRSTATRRPRGPVVAPPMLSQAVEAHECVLFLGTESSVLPGQQPQRAVLATLAAGREDDFLDGLADRLTGDRPGVDPETIAQMLERNTSADEVERALRRLARYDAFDLDIPKSRSRALTDLPFAGVLTEAWSGMEAAFASRKPTVLVPSEDFDLSPQSLLRSGAFFVAYLKGTLARPDTLRLSWRQSRHDIEANRELSRFLATLHSSHSLLFVGAGIDAIESYFESTPEVQGKRTHFAVVRQPGKDFEFQARSMEERFSVNLIPIWEEGEFTDLLRLLRPAPRSSRRDRMGPINIRPPHARRLRLENVGPFEELELPLSESATVILGDNGSGKSSVLRAIAVLLAGEGEAVDQAAAGLVRVGSARGEIELELEGDVLRTVLERERPGGVAVRCEQISPVAEGLWLGLGFPALRGTSLGSLRGPVDEAAGDPSADDVLPLAGNRIDFRFGDLQQWILNSAVLAEGRTGAARAARRTLDSFFAIVADLTPGSEFEFAGVEPDPWRVMVKTPDGLLPVDQLSRGMTATLGWVGVLLRRLFQIYGEEVSDPQAQSALVLVDEIDLHLHPAWQRQVLPVLRRHFPRVQLIASTHSPLVVGSMTEGGVIQLQRSGERIVPDVLEADFAGWRSDQILTGPAFELATTKAPAIEEKLAEYRQLLAGGLDSAEEKTRAEELAKLLQEGIPGPQETEPAREGAELVRDVIRHRLDQVPAERRDAVYREAEAYLQRLQGGKGAR